MRGQALLALLIVGATTAPLAARGQSKPVPVIGYLSTRSAGGAATEVGPFLKGLKEAGFVEGQNFKIEFRWAKGHYDRLPALAAELVKLRVAVLISAGGPLPARAAEAATSTIPIVFVSGADPVKFGLVHSFSRPGGNATGVDIVTHHLAPKRLGLLHELLPKAGVVAALIDPHNLDFQGQVTAVHDAAGALGLRADDLFAGNDSELGSAFAAMARNRVQALLVAASPYFVAQRKQLLALAARYRMPALYQFRDFAEAGGLASYGPNLQEAFRQAGLYAGRIVKGADPANMPVVISDKFDLVINLKTAKTLGLKVPRLLVLQANKVIE